jgi:DNA-binding NarL/FixJ family response regulator
MTTMIAASGRDLSVLGDITSERRRVFLLQNHPLMVLGTRSFLERQDDLAVCGSALTPEEVEQKLPRPLPDVLVYELCITGPFDFAFLRKLRQKVRPVPILAYSYHEETIFAERALQAGASGYLMKEAEPDRLAVALRDVLEGQIYLSERVLRWKEREQQAPSSINGARVRSLSNRELQIFQALGEGGDDEAISTQTGLSPSTIAGALYRIRRKLDLKTREELLHFSMHWAYYEGDFS